MQQSVQQSATLTGRPAARRRAPRLVGLLALVLLVLALALPAGAAASAAPPMISVTAPTGSASYAQYDSLTVSWTTSSATASGEFCVWLRSSSGGWYAAKLWPAGGGTSFGTSLVLDVPAGSGYQAIVAWRPTAGSGAWVSWGTSPDSFIVIGDPLLYTITSSVNDTRRVGRFKGTPTVDISPLGEQYVSPGGSMTFTITSHYRKRVGEGKRKLTWHVDVDGHSVGQPSTYTFPNVRANHTIEVFDTDR